MDLPVEDASTNSTVCTGPPPERSQDEEAKLAVSLSTAEYNLSLLVEWIKFADGKATFLLTVALALATASLAALPATTRAMMFFFDEGNGIVFCLLGLTLGTFCSALGVAMYQLLNVVRPRLRRDSETHSWYYFGSMGKLLLIDYRSFSQGLTIRDKIAQLDDQIFNNSCVACRKFELTRCAVLALATAILFGTLTIIPILVVDTIVNGGN